MFRLLQAAVRSLSLKNYSRCAVDFLIKQPGYILCSEALTNDLLLSGERPTSICCTGPRLFNSSSFLTVYLYCYNCYFHKTVNEHAKYRQIHDCLLGAVGHIFGSFDLKFWTPLGSRDSLWLRERLKKREFWLKNDCHHNCWIIMSTLNNMSHGRSL